MSSPVMSLEASLAEKLGTMFSSDELRRFLRHHVSVELVDDLPSPEAVSKNKYMALACEKLLARGLVSQRNFSTG